MTWYNTLIRKSKIKEILPYIHNRWINPSHKVVIQGKEFGIGHYHDPDTVLLHAAFQVLVDYIEIELPGIHSQYFQTPYQRFYDIITYIPGVHWFLRPPRNARQGLHHLRWELKLKKEHPSQAEAAEVQLYLYTFWKHTRPRRVDPWDATDLTTKEKRKNAVDVEDKYREEDDRMLHLLIDYNHTLWC